MAGAEETPLPELSADELGHEGAGRRDQDRRARGSAPAGSPEDDDGFDSEEFRRWLRQRDRRPRRRRHQGDSEEESDRERRDEGRSNAGPAPEWDGEALSFQDYAIKARLWLATTKAKARSRGPLLLQKLSKTPFETMKYLAKDQAWMKSETNGEDLIDLMEKPEVFGEDRDEDLLGALAKVTYHLRREKGETYRSFFGRWDVAMRKVTEHGVTLPEKYIGFLLINALNLQDSDIKSLVFFTQGSILQKDVRNWMRKYETKLQVSQVGTEPRRDKTNKLFYTEDVDDLATEDAELHMMEEALKDLRGEDDGGAGDLMDEDDDAIHTLEEHEAAEILATLVQKKRTFLQNAKTKKSVELGRGYRGGGPAPTSSSGSSSKPFARPGAGKFKATGKELKKVTKCGICKKPGHWWRECPHKDKEKEAHVLENPLEPMAESEEALFCGHMELQSEECDVSRNRLSPRITETDHRVDGHFLNEPTGHSAVRPAYKDRTSELLFNDHEGTSSKGSTASHDPPLIRDHVIHDDECATIDTGCQRMAVGRDTLSRLAERLPDGLPVNLVRQGHRFRSVHGRSSTTHVADLPTSLGPNGSCRYRSSCFAVRQTIWRDNTVSFGPDRGTSHPVVHIHAG